MPWKGEATKPSCDVKHRKSWLINEKIPKIMLYELMHRLKLFYHSFYKRKSTLFFNRVTSKTLKEVIFLCSVEIFFFLAGCLNSEASPRSESTQPVSNLWHATNGSMQIMLWGCFPVGTGGIQKGQKISRSFTIKQHYPWCAAKNGWFTYILRWNMVTFWIYLIFQCGSKPFLGIVR